VAAPPKEAPWDTNLGGGMKIPSARHGVRGVALVGAALGLALSLGAGSAGASGPSKALAQAKTHLLKLSDMPKAWTSQPSSNSGSNDFPGKSQLAPCIGVPLSVINLNPPKVSSPDFGNKASTYAVSENIKVFSSTKVAKTAYAAVTSPKTPGCYAQVLNGPAKSTLLGAFPSGATLSTITVVPATGSLHGYTAAFTVTAQGQTVHLVLTTLFALKGTEGMQLEFTGYGSTFPSSLAKHLSSVAVGRL
jgi:hypothetical protein